MPGAIYCGDNLDVLPEYVPPESVDLVYLDPPFNSQRTYNIVYKDSGAQAEAFKDYWSWEEAAATFERVVEGHDTPRRLRHMLRSLRELLIDDDSDMLAYLSMMTARLLALHRVLKPTGAMYLHCDPTASHYLKIILDAVFGADRFYNEIIWQRTNARVAAGRWPRVHDVLLFYSKQERPTFNPIKIVGEAQKLPHTLITGPDGKKYQTFELTAPNLRFGETGRPWRGFQPAKMGRCWANPPSVMDEWDRQGLVHWPKKKGAWPRRRAAEPFVPEERMITVGDVWTDIDRINQSAKERLGYPTQKPLSLLMRIIEASSNPGDLVLDPFCGCGTTIEACERMGRRWIGIDIARKAVEVIEERFKKVELAAPTVVWHPVDIQAAAALAERDAHQFEDWALRRVRAARRRKKDRGIDGEALFREPDGARWHVLISVKGGRHLAPTMVRDLRGTIEREGAPIGVLVSMYEPSREMRLEATRAGFVPGVEDSEGPIPKIQLVTVDRLFSRLPPIRAPGVNVTEMPQPTVPQLSLDIDTTVAEPSVKKARVRRPGTAKAAPPMPVPAAPPAMAVAERTITRPPPPSSKRGR